MLSSVLSSVLFAGLAASSVLCPIKSYDARPGYGIACVFGDKQGVYEDRLVQDLYVAGSMYAASLPFECVRTIGYDHWLGYNIGGRLCWVTEGNVEGEENNVCFTQLKECNTAWY